MASCRAVTCFDSCEIIFAMAFGFLGLDLGDAGLLKSSPAVIMPGPGYSAQEAEVEWSDFKDCDRRSRMI